MYHTEDGSISMTEMAFQVKKKKENVIDVAFTYVVPLSPAISLAYLVRQLNRNVETPDYSDLFT